MKSQSLPSVIWRPKKACIIVRRPRIQKPNSSIKFCPKFESLRTRSTKGRRRSMYGSNSQAEIEFNLSPPLSSVPQWIGWCLSTLEWGGIYFIQSPIQLQISLDSILPGIPPGNVLRGSPGDESRRPTFYPWIKKIPWRREGLPTLVFLPGESHGQRSYSPWGHKESDMTERLALSFLGLKWHIKLTL